MSTENNNSGNTGIGGLNLVATLFLAILVIGVIVLFFIYGLPMIKDFQNLKSGDGINVNVEMPTPTIPQDTTPEPTLVP
ncbi:MAG: hypothetical protein WC711_00225 [Candidatus Staskawiczbacteria bacterium]|jgi:hypothetical protein